MPRCPSLRRARRGLGDGGSGAAGTPRGHGPPPAAPGRRRRPRSATARSACRGSSGLGLAAAHRRRPCRRLASPGSAFARASARCSASAWRRSASAWALISSVRSAEAGEALGDDPLRLLVGVGEPRAGFLFGLVDHLFGRPLGGSDDLGEARRGRVFDLPAAGGAVSAHSAPKPRSDSPISPTARSIWSASTTSGGSSRSVSGRGDVDDEARAPAGRRRPRRASIPSSKRDADHQPAAARAGDAGQFLEAPPQPRRPARAPSAAAPGRRRCRGPPAPPRVPIGPAAKVEPWSPGCSTSAAAGAGDAGADRHAAAERLGAGDHVRAAPASARRPRASRSARSRSGSRRRSAARRPRRRLRAPPSAPRRWSARPRTRPGSARSAPPRCSARPPRAAPRRRCRGPRRSRAGIGPSASLRASFGVAESAP